MTVEPAPEFLLTGVVEDVDHGPITSGELLLYRKNDDGTIENVSHVMMDGENQFSFVVDQHEYALYFIPARITLPTYAPTLLNGSFELNDDAFVRIHGDSSILFKVLPLAEHPEGTRLVDGHVQEQAGEGHRGDTHHSETILGFKDVIVLFLDDSENILDWQNTDASGYYKFEDFASQKL